MCSGEDEYASVAEAIAEPAVAANAPPTEEILEGIAHALVEYFDGVAEGDARKLVCSAAIDAWGADVARAADLVMNDSDNGVSDGGGSDLDGMDTNCDDHLDDGLEDGDFIGEGECELCERRIKLTRHHLVPKATWPRMKKRLWNAAPVIESLHALSLQCEDETSDDDRRRRLRDTRGELLRKLEKTVGTADLRDLPTIITRDTVRGYLTQVCLLCRQCHSAVHRIHTEWELAMEYNTMERLLDSEEVMKFGKWANKQRPGNKT